MRTTDKSRIKIQLLGDDSIDQILAIEQQAHLTPWSPKKVRSCFGNDVIHVIGCYYDIELIGYGVMQVIDPEVEIQNFVIAKTFQRQGIGGYFLKRLIRHCQRLSLKKIMLEVRQSNDVAIRLYLASGFKQVGCRKNYYKTKLGRESALLLTRFL